MMKVIPSILGSTTASANVRNASQSSSFQVNIILVAVTWKSLIHNMFSRFNICLEVLKVTLRKSVYVYCYENKIEIS